MSAFLIIVHVVFFVMSVFSLLVADSERGGCFGLFFLASAQGADHL